RLRLAQVAFYVAPGRLGEWLEPAERDVLALGEPTLLAYVRLAQASALYIQGRFAEALPLLERIRPTAESTADPVLRAQFPRVYGQLQALRGDYVEAVPALLEAIGLLGRAHGWLAEVELARDQPDEALRLAEAGLEVSTDHGYLYDAALCERARGEALGALGDRQSARQALENAAAQFTAIGANPEVTRTRGAIAALG